MIFYLFSYNYRINFFFSPLRGGGVKTVNFFLLFCKLILMSFSLEKKLKKWEAESSSLLTDDKSVHHDESNSHLIDDDDSPIIMKKRGRARN